MARWHLPLGAVVHPLAEAKVFHLFVCGQWELEITLNVTPRFWLVSDLEVTLRLQLR